MIHVHTVAIEKHSLRTLYDGCVKQAGLLLLGATPVHLQYLRTGRPGLGRTLGADCAHITAQLNTPQVAWISQDNIFYTYTACSI